MARTAKPQIMASRIKTRKSEVMVWECEKMRRLTVGVRIESQIRPLVGRRTHAVPARTSEIRRLWRISGEYSFSE